MSPSPALSVVVYGDGQWAADSVRALLRGPHRVAGVVLRSTPSDSSLGDVARGAGIPVLQPADINAEDARRAIAALSGDLGISIAYNQIFRREARAVHRHGVVNFHAGMLPRYRGRNVINWAIINGEEELGLTAHLVDDGIDTGDIILQESLPIGWTDGYGDVLRRVVERMPALVVAAIDLLAAGEGQRRPQAHLPGTYFGGRGEGDEWIDWTWSSRRVHNFIRAITRPGPGARTLLAGQVVTIWSAYYDPFWPNYIATPGQVVGRRPDGALVKTGDSTILVKEAAVGEGPARAPDWRVGTRLGVDQRDFLHRSVLRGGKP